MVLFHYRGNNVTKSLHYGRKIDKTMGKKRSDTKSIDKWKDDCYNRGVHVHRYKENEVPIMLTSKEIAAIAGVSRATVYRVINNKPNVKPDVREKVMQVIRAHDYTPNPHGTALVNRKRTFTVGVLLPEIKQDFYRTVLEGIQKAIEDETGVRLALEVCTAPIAETEEQAACVEQLCARGVHGLLAVCADEPLIRQKIEESGLPLVAMISDIEARNKILFVGNDLYKSGSTAAGLLQKICRGPQRVGILCTSKRLPAHRARIDGFCDRLQEIAPDFEVVRILETRDDSSVTASALRQLLRIYKVSAVYCTTGGGMAGMGEALKGAPCTFIASDQSEDVMELMRQQKIAFSICQQPYFEGYTAAKAMVEHLVYGKSPAQAEVFSKVEILTAENMD